LAQVKLEDRGEKTRGGANNQLRERAFFIHNMKSPRGGEGKGVLFGCHR